jgi:anthranilate synthase component 1
MQLIAELEREKRGVYAGAVGYFGYPSVNSVSGSPDFGTEDEGAMDTCIALRTMVVKDGVAFLQAGGGIVFDSDEGEEYEETINKAAANMRCIEQAELLHWEEQQEDAGEVNAGVVVNEDEGVGEASGRVEVGGG